MANTILYGFHNLADVKNRLIDDVGIPLVRTAADAAIAEWNRQLETTFGLFVMPTIEYKVKFKSAANARLQPLDEDGRARPIKGFGKYDTSFPVQMAGSAYGSDYVAAKKMTVQDANDAMATMFNADMNWMRDHIMAALLTNANWNFEDEEHGSLVIKPIANGDSDVYQVLAGGANQSTADHFMAQAAIISDAANPFPTIFKKLKDRPENDGQVVVLVASNLTADIQNLANFKERGDENIRQGANSDILVGNLGVNVPGVVVGYVDGCWIVEWSRLPSGYYVATTTGGDKALAMREDAETNLRGFRRVAERDNHPFYETQYLRRAGFGAWNRVNAVVGRIGNATYVVPSGYESPMS